VEAGATAVGGILLAIAKAWAEKHGKGETA
jgi:hypothetical protein